MAAPRRSFGHRFYTWLLRLFPRDFRGDFGDEMTSVFEDEQTAAHRIGGGAPARLWGRTLAGLVMTGAQAWAADLAQDLRMAARALRRSPGYSLVAITMLALGTGANAAIFSVVDAVLIQTPFADRDRIVIVTEQPSTGTRTQAIPLADVDAITKLPIFDAVSPLGGGSPILTGFGPPQRLSVECVRTDMFRVIGTQPIRGRVFTADDDRAGATPVVLLSYDFWQRTLGADDGVIGRTIALDGRATAIVGVMPRGFRGGYSRNSLQLWAPLGPAIARDPSSCTLRASVAMFAKLKPGLSVNDAAAAIQSTLPAAPEAANRPRALLGLMTLDDETFGDYRGVLLALVGAVGCVLMIACANVANLQLERIVGRRRELAVRLALGASRSRIIRHTLTESALLGLVGAAGGLLLASATSGLLIDLLPTTLPRLNEIALNGRALGVTIGVALVTTLTLGLLPAFQASRVAMIDDLRDDARTTTAHARWIRPSLVVGEVALSLLLLIGASLAVRTFLILRPSDPGFDPAHKLTLGIRLASGYVVVPENAAFVDALSSRVRALPGVVSVSTSTYLPLGSSVSLFNATIGGRSADVWTASVTPEFFTDLQVTATRGRLIAPEDLAGAPAVVAVNETFARRFWPDVDPIGQVFDLRTPDGRVVSRRVVGVVHDMRGSGMDTKARSELYIPYAQEPQPFFNLIVRTTDAMPPGLPDAIRSTIAELRPALVVNPAVSLESIAARSVATPRFIAWLMGLFAAIAVALAGIGLAAVIAWSVARRTREIGIRMALGARTAQVAGAVVRQGLGLAILGVAIGLAAAMAATRLLSDWLYGVTPTDPITFAGAAVFMLTLAAAASYLPARRAARVDPIITLRAN